MKTKSTILLVIMILVFLTGSIKIPPRLIVDKRITLFAYYTIPPKEYNFEDRFENMITESFLDLDTGENGNETISELYYSVSCGTMCLSNIHDIRRETSRKIGTEEPSYFDCYRILFEPNGDESVGTSLVGYYSCYLTDEGRLSQIYIVDKKIWDGEAKIIIEVRTWDEVVVGN